MIHLKYIYIYIYLYSALVIKMRRSNTSTFAYDILPRDRQTFFFVVYCNRKDNRTNLPQNFVNVLRLAVT